MDAAGHARAVVNGHDVMPAIRSDAFFGLHAEGVVEPARHQIELEFAIVEHETVAGRPRRFGHLRQNNAALLAARVDPGAEGKLVVKAEVGDVAGFYIASAVEEAGKTQPAGSV